MLANRINTLVYMCVFVHIRERERVITARAREEKRWNRIEIN